MERTRTNTDRDQLKPHHSDPKRHRFKPSRNQLEPATIRSRPLAIHSVVETFVFRPFRYLSVPDRCVVVTDTTFFAPIRWGPAPRKPSKRCRRVTLNNNNSTMNHCNRKELPMTQKVIVLTWFAKLSDALALSTAVGVIKGIYVDKVFVAPPPFDEAPLRTSVD